MEDESLAPKKHTSLLILISTKTSEIEKNLCKKKKKNSLT